MTTRRPFMLLAAAALLAALWAGLVRLGWALPSLPVAPPAEHGPLMVTGFLGTVIALERAVALSHHRPRQGRLFYLAPLLAGLGGLALLAGLTVAGRALAVGGAMILTAMFALVYRLQPTSYHAVMGLGALHWLGGNALWLAGMPVYQVTPWWAGFLVLTIAGERLELSRVLRLTGRVQASFTGVVGLFLIGLLFSMLAYDAGVRLMGVGLLGLGVWLLRFDLARRTVRQEGLTRFIAACLLLGYVWLAAGGGLWLWYGGAYTAGPIHDALLHTIFLGFVLSMIFGHAPIIVPAVLGLAVAYSPAFYLHLAMLHLSLLLRVAGDLLGWTAGRQWGGLLNEAALLWFLVAMVVAVRQARSVAGDP
jgi:hypothetical protein